MSSRPLAFIHDAVDRHGEDLGGGLVRVPRSQVALAAEAGCSAGTVAYYLHQLRGAVRRERDGIVVDLTSLQELGADELARRRSRVQQVAQALAETWGEPTPDAGVFELRTPQGRPPTVREMAERLGVNPSTVQRHLDHLGRQGLLRRCGQRLLLSQSHPHSPTPQSPAGYAASPQSGGQELELLAALATTLIRQATELAELGQQILEVAARRGLDTPAGPRDEARGDPRSVGAQFAENRDSAPTVASAQFLEKTRKLERSSLTDSVEPRTEGPLRDDVRGLRESEPTVPVSAARSEVLSDSTAVDAALEPLRRLCHELNLPTTIDDHGRRWLGRYSPAELALGVAEMVRLVRNGAHLPAAKQVRRPMSLLVAKAMRGEEAFFVAPPPPPPPKPVPLLVSEEPEPIDHEALAVIGELDADSLEQLDQAVRAQLEALTGRSRSRTIDAVFASPTQLLQWRFRVWRQRNQEAS